MAQGLAQVDGGERELDVVGEPAAERLVDRLGEVRGQDRQAVEPLEPLQEVVDLEVGEPIVGGVDLGGALAEQRVGLVEQEHDVAGLGGVEDLGEVLLGLADPLRHHLRQVDLVDRQAELARDHGRAHRLADAGRAREQDRDAGRAAEPPVLADAAALADRGDDLAEQRAGVGVGDDVVERVRRVERLAEALQPAVELVAHREVEPVEVGRAGDARRARRHLDHAAGDREAIGQLAGDLGLEVGQRALPQLDPGVAAGRGELDVDHRPHPQRR